mgnify:CR=1 FL=1
MHALEKVRRFFDDSSPATLISAPARDGIPDNFGPSIAKCSRVDLENVP